MRMNRFNATIEVVRPHNMIAAAVCVGAGYYIAGGREMSVVILPVVLTALVVGFGNLINDYYDADIDRVNKPRRPIPSGRLSPGYVLRLYWPGSVLLAVAAFLLVPKVLALIILLWQVLLFLYARKLKRLPMLGHLLVGLVSASAFLYGALAAGDIASVGFPVLFAFLFSMGRELVKGAEDVEGDRIAGARTLSVRLGPERTGELAACFMLVCVVTAPLPVLLGYYGLWYAMVMELVVVPGLLVAVYEVLHHPGRAILNRASWILKIEIFFGITAMALGNL
jgi:geranylgeranylglycerol-phosphate geranylgeranyltransferase